MSDRISEKALGPLAQFLLSMDDILVAVPTIAKGEAAIARLQRCLEALGLYPNAAKTRILDKSEYVRDFMVKSQAEIDQFNNEIKDQTMRWAPYEQFVFPHQVERVRAMSSCHRSASPRPKRWNNTTGRLYTVHRSIGLRDWWDSWLEDLEGDPSSAAKIFEYVRAWPLSSDTLSQLLCISMKYGELYANLSILSAEVVLTCPIGDDRSLWSEVALESRREFERLSSKASEGTGYERMAASWLIAAEYLRNVQDGNKRAVDSALGVLKPRVRLMPQRFTVLPRVLPLLDIVGRVRPEQVSKVSASSLRALRKNPIRLRDMRLEFIFEQWRL